MVHCVHSIYNKVFYLFLFNSLNNVSSIVEVVRIDEYNILKIHLPECLIHSIHLGYNKVNYSACLVFFFLNIYSILIFYSKLFIVKQTHITNGAPLNSQSG